jgi:hypothetical protein
MIYTENTFTVANMNEIIMFLEAAGWLDATKRRPNLSPPCLTIRNLVLEVPFTSPVLQSRLPNTKRAVLLGLRRRYLCASFCFEQLRLLTIAELVPDDLRVGEGFWSEFDLSDAEQWMKDLLKFKVDPPNRPEMWRGFPSVDRFSVLWRVGKVDAAVEAKVRQLTQHLPGEKWTIKVEQAERKMQQEALGASEPDEFRRRE